MKFVPDLKVIFLILNQFNEKWGWLNFHEFFKRGMLVKSEALRHCRSHIRVNISPLYPTFPKTWDKKKKENITRPERYGATHAQVGQELTSVTRISHVSKKQILAYITYCCCYLQSPFLKNCWVSRMIHNAALVNVLLLLPRIWLNITTQSALKKGVNFIVLLLYFSFFNLEFVRHPLEIIHKKKSWSTDRRAIVVYMLYGCTCKSSRFN